MHNLMINTAWTKPQFARASSEIARKISQSQMGLRDDPKKLKSGDIALIKTEAIAASVAEGLRRRSTSSTETKADDSFSSINTNCSSNNHSQQSTCEWLKEGLHKLKSKWEETSPQTRSAIKSSMIAVGVTCIGTLIICLQEGKNAEDTITLMIRNGGLAGVSAGILSLITDFAVNHWEVLKNFFMGLGCEITEKTAKQYCTALTGAVFCSFMDMILWTVNAWSSGDSWAKFGQKFFIYLCDSIALNMASAGIGILVANACPMWATLIIMLMAGHCIGRIKQQSVDNQTSFIGSIFYGIAVIPVSIYNSIRNIRDNDVPNEMCCVVNQTLLRHPVWVQGQWMDREVAYRLAENKGRGPAGYGVTRDGIVESGEMRNLVNGYRNRFGEEE